MNKYYVNNNFNGAIYGKRCVEYFRQATNIKPANKEEGLKEINKLLGTEIINGVEFYDDFWTKIFIQRDEEEFIGGVKLVLSKDDSLYSESNIASTLEYMGTLIIRSERKRDNPEQYVKIFDSYEMFKKALDEQNEIRHVTENTSDGKYAIEKGFEDLFILKNQMNYKLEKRFDKLDDKHLSKLDKEYGTKYPQVHDYYIGYLNMKKVYENLIDLRKEKGYLTKKEKTNLKFISKNIRSLKEDFINCITAKVRPIIFKCPLPDKGYPSWDEYDDLDDKHIHAALSVIKGNDLQDDLSVIIRDLDNTIKECKFTKQQNNIVQLVRKGKNHYEIAEILNIARPNVTASIKTCSKKIANKNLEKYTDWYMLNITMGKYEKCKICGSNKLINSSCKFCDEKKRGRK